MNIFQTLCLVVSGYLASRLLVRLGLHVRAVAAVVRRCRRRPQFLLLAMMGGCAGLSLVLPNALTVLAVLPLVELVVNQVKTRGGKDGAGPDKALVAGTVTAMVLAVIYGANIGGIGSLLGSPANLYLILSMEVLDFPGRSAVHFVSWLAFGLPLATVLIFVAWAVLWAFTPRRVLDALVGVELEEQGPGLTRGFVRRGSAVLVGLLLAHAVLLAVTALWSGEPLFSFSVLGKTRNIGWGDVAAAGLTVLTAAVLMGVRMRPGGKGSPREPLLRRNDLVGHLPWRGLALAGGAIVFLVLVAKLGGAQLVERLARAVVDEGSGALLFTIIITAVCLFATEALNNTTTATLLFPLVLILSKQVGVAPVPVAVAVSMASTCAFMTPVATPVNALAFGAFKGVRLRTMFMAGAMLNTVSALFIGFWVYLAVPRILALFS